MHSLDNARAPPTPSLVVYSHNASIGLGLWRNIYPVIHVFDPAPRFAARLHDALSSR